MEFIDEQHIQTLLDLPPARRAPLVREAAIHLSEIHQIRVTERYGPLEYVDGELTVGTGFHSWTAFFDELVDVVTAELLGEGELTDATPQLADLEPKIRAALTDHPLTDLSPPLGIVTGDCRPSNLVLSSGTETEQLVEVVIDVGGDVGDPLLDVAITEEALIDTPLGQTPAAESL